MWRLEVQLQPSLRTPRSSWSSSPLHYAATLSFRHSNSPNCQGCPFTGTSGSARENLESTTPKDRETKATKPTAAVHYGLRLLVEHWLGLSTKPGLSKASGRGVPQHSDAWFVPAIPYFREGPGFDAFGCCSMVLTNIPQPGTIPQSHDAVEPASCRTASCPAR